MDINRIFEKFEDLIERLYSAADDGQLCNVGDIIELQELSDKLKTEVMTRLEENDSHKC